LSAIDLDNDGLPDRIFVANPNGEIHVLMVSADSELRHGQSLRVDHELSALNPFSRTESGQRSFFLDAGGTRGITRFTLSASGTLIDPGVLIESRELLEAKQDTIASNVVVVDRKTWAVQSHFNCLDRMICTAVSPDGNWIAIAGESERIHLWSPGGVWRGTIPGLFANIRSMLFTDDSKRLCIAVGDVAEVYDPVSMNRIHRLQGHENTISIMATAPHSDVIATASDDTTVCLWSLKTGALLKKMIGHIAVPRAIAFHPNEQLVASCDAEGQIILWDVSTGGELLRLQSQNGNVHRLFFESPGRLNHASNDTNSAPLSNGKIEAWSIENMGQY
jgi:WD40 repeat protein